jgi:hypothetical protein
MHTSAFVCVLVPLSLSACADSLSLCVCACACVCSLSLCGSIFGLYMHGSIADGCGVGSDVSTTARVTQEEKRAAERLHEDQYNDLRRAAEVHRHVRRDAHAFIQPGRTLTEIVERIEGHVRALLPADGLKAGHAFPTGCSLNHCAAHYSPNPGDTTVLRYEDVCKIDFGVQVNGTDTERAREGGTA